MQSLLKEISGIGIIPVLKSENQEKALKLVEILCRQSLPVVEIALRSSATLELIQVIKQRYPQVIIGVSNVLTQDQLEDALIVGADYISTVHVNAALIEMCLAKSVAVIPECPSSVDIDQAKAMGVNCVKLLSSTPLSELKMVKELSERYKDMRFMISSGIESNLFVDYLNVSSVMSCCTSDYYREKELENQAYDVIEANVEKLVKELLGLELAHVGVNSSDDAAAGLAQEFGSLLKEAVRETPISFFAGNTVEVMKSGGRGEHGHIGYRVNNVAKAMHYFLSKGYHFVPETFKKDENGEIFFAYFEEEIGGFAIHLVKK